MSIAISSNSRSATSINVKNTKRANLVEIIESIGSDAKPGLMRIEICTFSSVRSNILFLTFDFSGMHSAISDFCSAKFSSKPHTRVCRIPFTYYYLLFRMLKLIQCDFIIIIICNFSPRILHNYFIYIFFRRITVTRHSTRHKSLNLQSDSRKCCQNFPVSKTNSIFIDSSWLYWKWGTFRALCGTNQWRNGGPQEPHKCDFRPSFRSPFVHFIFSNPNQSTWTQKRQSFSFMLNFYFINFVCGCERCHVESIRWNKFLNQCLDM